MSFALDVSGSNPPGGATIFPAAAESCEFLGCFKILDFSSRLSSFGFN